MTLYYLKPRFQALLRPFMQKMAAIGVTANQATLAAALGSASIGALLCAFPSPTELFLTLPVWLFLRMALNAIDGMLAREKAQKSRLGGYLNELCDVISDAALMWPFAFVPPFGPTSVFLVIFLSGLSEQAGAMGPLVGASRRYDGPFGKSDRALAIGALGLWTGLAPSLPAFLFWLLPLMAALLVLTIANRVRCGLSEA